MAKYSKEQRRCAVELYVRYECCAADMVRGLGYPSREASRMWHRDWLEEQRTGVPSTRGGAVCCFNGICWAGSGRASVFPQTMWADGFQPGDGVIVCWAGSDVSGLMVFPGAAACIFPSCNSNWFRPVAAGRCSGRKGSWRYRCPLCKISGDSTGRECRARR